VLTTEPVDRRFAGGQYRRMPTSDAREGALIRRLRRGQLAAARRQLELCAAEGPNPEQAVAEALAAFDLVCRGKSQPSERDPVSEREVTEVRRRWARIQKRAQGRR
jgi:hypothetical protein